MNPRLLAGLLAAALVAGEASAQQYPGGNPPPASPYGTAVRPPPVSQPPAGFQSSSGPTVVNVQQPPGGGGQQYAPGDYYPPYGGYPYIPTPQEGYLNGVAAVTTANGEYMSQVQQARLQQAQADMAKLDFRRKFAEQQQYLKSLQPTPEEIRQKEIIDGINRSLNNPPPTEIWSGVALNNLLIDIQRAQRAGVVGPAVPVDNQTLRHINLTTGNTTAGAGLLKDLRRFQWPIALQDDAFKDDRTNVERLARMGADEAASGPVEARLIVELKKGVDGMIATLKSKVDDFSPTQYVQAMRYLRELNDSVKVLQDPNASAYLTDKYAATGNTVAELVQGMTSRGLTFAPAASGDQPYYTALHSAMAAYDSALRQLAAR